MTGHGADCFGVRALPHSPWTAVLADDRARASRRLCQTEPPDASQCAVGLRAPFRTGSDVAFGVGDMSCSGKMKGPQDGD